MTAADWFLALTGSDALSCFATKDIARWLALAQAVLLVTMLAVAYRAVRLIPD